MDYRFYPDGTVIKTSNSDLAKDLPLGTVEYIAVTDSIWVVKSNTLGGVTPWWSPVEWDDPIRKEIKAKLLLLKE